MTTSRSDSATPMVTTFTIEGMTCGSCVRHVRQALVELDGVTNAEVDLASRTARVTHRPDLASADSMAAAVAEAGYGATPAAR